MHATTKRCAERGKGVGDLLVKREFAVQTSWLDLVLCDLRERGGNHSLGFDETDS